MKRNEQVEEVRRREIEHCLIQLLAGLLSCRLELLCSGRFMVLGLAWSIPFGVWMGGNARHAHTSAHTHVRTLTVVVVLSAWSTIIGPNLEGLGFTQVWMGNAERTLSSFHNLDFHNLDGIRRTHADLESLCAVPDSIADSLASCISAAAAVTLTVILLLISQAEAGWVGCWAMVSGCATTIFMGMLTARVSQVNDPRSAALSSCDFRNFRFLTNHSRSWVFSALPAAGDHRGVRAGAGRNGRPGVRRRAAGHTGRAGGRALEAHLVRSRAVSLSRFSDRVS